MDKDFARGVGPDSTRNTRTSTGRIGYLDSHREPAKLPVPTDKIPHTIAKERVCRKRLENDECIHHPADRKWDPIDTYGYHLAENNRLIVHGMIDEQEARRAGTVVNQNLRKFKGKLRPQSLRTYRVCDRETA